MKKKIIYAIISLLLITFGIVSISLNNKDDKGKNLVVSASQINLNLNCESAYLIEESSGKILYSYNENKKMHPASMTKMMGLLLVCEALENNQITLDEMVSISSNASSMGGSQVFLQPLEQISVDELIKCVCIASANDAMYALSELVSTTNQNFINMMNDKVKELNLENTNFVNVTGFDDDNHYSCAKDMALIAKELLKYKEIILPYTSTYDSYIRQDSPSPFWLVNTNKMVKYYTGMDGLKTGYTSKSGFCLTSTALRNNVRLISVVMNAKTSQLRNEDTKTLLDYGFSKVKCVKLYEKDSIISTLSLPNVLQKNVPLYCKEDVLLIYEDKLIEDEIQKKIIINDNYKFPIKKDSEIGYLLITYKDQAFTFPIYVKDEITPLKVTDLLFNYLKDILL